MAYLAAPILASGANQPQAASFRLTAVPVVRNTIVPAPYVYTLVAPRSPIGMPI